jgi:hypothetical protein
MAIEMKQVLNHIDQRDEEVRTALPRGNVVQ